jgi:uncharacterized membrane protein YqjE
MASQESGAASAPASERSVAELTGDLAREMASLVQHEIELARVEMTEKSKRLGLGAGMFGTAGLCALFGLGCLSACAIAALAQVMSVWLAALIVGGAYLVIAGITALAGRAELRAAAPPVPEGAVESSKEDVQWLKRQAKSARR